MVVTFEQTQVLNDSIDLYKTEWQIRAFDVLIDYAIEAEEIYPIYQEIIKMGYKIKFPIDKLFEFVVSFTKYQQRG